MGSAQDLVNWYLACHNRLDKVKPKAGVKQEDPERVLEAGAIGTVMHDTLYTLQATLQNVGLDKETNPTLRRPHFKGGKNAFADFENFEKNFKLWTRNLNDNVKLLQLLRDTFSGPALEQIEELDVCAENYKKAWDRLTKIYNKKEEFRSLLIDRIFNYQFINVKLDMMEEHFNSYCILIDKLKTSHKIDLLNVDTGVDTVLAHLTFKKFPQKYKKRIDADM